MTRGLECARGRREVGRGGNAGHVGIARGVDGDAVALLEDGAAAAQVGGVDEPAADRIQLGHKGIGSAGTAEGATGSGRLESPRSSGKVRRVRSARHVGAAEHVECDTEALFEAAAAEVGGVDQPAAGRIQLRDEGIFVAAVRRLERRRSSREVGRDR